MLALEYPDLLFLVSGMKKSHYAAKGEAKGDRPKVAKSDKIVTKK